MTLEEAREAIAALSFRFAKTMPQIPHWYAVRSTENIAEWNALAAAIKEHGTDGQFGGRRYKYFRPGDGHRYWQMGIIINKAVDD